MRVAQLERARARCTFTNFVRFTCARCAVRERQRVNRHKTRHDVFARERSQRAHQLASFIGLSPLECERNVLTFDISAGKRETPAQSVRTCGDISVSRARAVFRTGAIMQSHCTHTRASELNTHTRTHKSISSETILHISFKPECAPASVRQSGSVLCVFSRRSRRMVCYQKAE